MRFHGLPPELHVGAVDLAVVSPCSMLESCICLSCRRASPTYFICAADHVACSSCCVSDPSSDLTWCPGCQRRVQMNTAKIPSKTIAKWRFRCACGIEGTLAAIREHLLEDGGTTHTRGSTAAQSMDARTAPFVSLEQQESSQQDGCRTIAVKDNEWNKVPDGSLTSVSELKQQLQMVEQGFMRRLEEVHERISLVDNTRIIDINEIKNVLKSERENYSRENVSLATRILHQVATSQKAFFWFDFDKLYKKYAESANVTSSDWQYKVTAAICFGVMIRLEKLNNVDYLGVLAAPKNKIKTGFPWPVARRVTVGVHDKNGCTVTSKYCDYVYRDPQALGVGFLHILDTASLYSKYCLVQGKLCISLEISPIE